MKEIAIVKAAATSLSKGTSDGISEDKPQVFITVIICYE